MSGLADSPGEVGSATFISAATTGSAATLCWVGDSRAYWLGAPVTPAPESPAPRVSPGSRIARSRDAARAPETASS